MLGVSCQPQLTDVEVLTVSTFTPILSHPPGPWVTRRGTQAAEGCLPQPLSRQPLTQRWSCVCAAQPGSRWSLVQVRGSSKQSLVFDRYWKQHKKKKKTVSRKKYQIISSKQIHKILSCCIPDRLTRLPPCLFCFFLKRNTWGVVICLTFNWQR